MGVGQVPPDPNRNQKGVLDLGIPVRVDASG